MPDVHGKGQEPVLFKRYGVPPEKRDWEFGYVDGRFEFEGEPWVTIVPAAPEGKQAPTSLTVPDSPAWIDPIREVPDAP